MALARRRRMLVGLVVFALGVAVGGLVVARFVRSPEQALADLEPPPAAVLLEPVGKRVISQTLILRGSAAAEGAVTLSLAGLSAESTAAVVTATPVKEGAQIEPGTVILEVAGRPLILLPGAVPQYRDLNPGDRGDDVTQLQQGLAELGHEVKITGRYDAGTSQAVRSLYTDLGYDAREVGDLKELRAAERAVKEAEIARNDARTKVKGAVDAPSQQAAQREQQQAEATLADAISDRDELRATTGYALPRTETVFAPGAVRLDKLGARVGLDLSQTGASGNELDPQSAEGTLALSWGVVTCTAGVSPEQAPLLRKGTRVELMDEMGGWQGKGVVTAAPDPSQGAEQTVTIGPAEGTFPVSLPGKNLRVTFIDARTTEEVLAVPVAALTTDASGAPAVERMRDGERAHVPVTVGAKGDGYLQVTPQNPDDLTKGDQVVVGITQPVPQPRPS